MDVREWRRLVRMSTGLLVVVLLVSFLFFVGKNGDVEHTVYAQGQEDTMEILPEPTAERQEAQASEEEEAESVSDSYIRIRKPDQGTVHKVYLENDYNNSAVSLTLDGVGLKKYQVTDIERFYQDQSFLGEYQEGKDMVEKIQIATENQKEKESVTIRMRLKDIYEPTLFETLDAYYISLEKPEDVYEHIVVVDAGHGGIDEGTMSLDQKYSEKNCALRIVRYLKEIMDKDSRLKVYYTRLDDTDVPKAQRVQLANRVHADVFVSVHCNASGPGDTTANGVEALYSSKKKTSSDDMTSRQLASCLLDGVCDTTGYRSRGVIRRNKLYLMNHSKVPVAIIEVGYMSNQSDLRYLLREKGQRRLAKGIYRGILSGLEIE